MSSVKGALVSCRLPGKWWNFIKEENMDTIVYDAVQDVKAVAEYNGGA